MAEVLKNSLQAGAGLGVAEYLTGAVSSVVDTITGKVSGVLGNTSAPAVGKLAPFALGANALWQGVKETKSSNVYNGVAHGALHYGIPGAVLTAAGIAIPGAQTALAVGAGMWGLKHFGSAVSGATSAIKNGKPVDWTLNALKAPLRGITSLPGLKWLRPQAVSA